MKDVMGDYKQDGKPSWGWRTAGLCGVLGLVGLAFGAWFSGTAPKLIVTAEMQTAATAHAAGAKRVEKVTFSKVALEELARPGGRVTLVAFGGDPMRIQVDKVKEAGERSGVSLGKIAGDPDSQVVMARENEVWAGSVSTGDGRFLSIRPGDGGAYFLEELDPALMGECGSCGPKQEQKEIWTEDGLGVMAYDAGSVADPTALREMRQLLRMIGMGETGSTMMVTAGYAEDGPARRTLLRRIAGSNFGNVRLRLIRGGNRRRLIYVNRTSRPTNPTNTQPTTPGRVNTRPVQPPVTPTTRVTPTITTPTGPTPGTRPTNNVTTPRPITPVNPGGTNIPGTRPNNSGGTLVNRSPRRPSNPGGTGGGSPSGGGNGTIDLMVVYTPAARESFRGQDGVKAAIRASVARMNAALRASGVSSSVNLVHSQEVAYTESSSPSSDLKSLSRGGNDLGSTVARLRNQHNADIVTMVAKSYGHVSGIGWLLSRPRAAPNTGFNIVTVGGLRSFTMAHEIGHNLGCCHAQDDPGTSRGAFQASYGHRFNATVTSRGRTNQRQYRTIMAYSPGSRIGHYSNPSVNYHGVPTGTDSANNAATINQTAGIVSDYRGSGQ